MEMLLTILLLSFTLTRITFAISQTTFPNTTTTAFAAVTPSCGPCAICFDGDRFIWDTGFITVNQTIATKLIIVDNATNVTGVSIRSNTITDRRAYGDFNRDGGATYSFTETSSVNGTTTVITTILTSPTPYFIWNTEYSILGPTWTSGSLGLRCAWPSNYARVGTPIPLPSSPTYFPTGIEFESIKSGVDPDVPRGLFAEFSTLSDFQRCPTPGILPGIPQTLVAAVYLTETTTIYQAATSPKAQIPPVRSSELSQVSDIKVGDQPSQQPSSTAKPSEVQTTSALSPSVMVPSMFSAELPPSVATQLPSPQPIQTSIVNSSPASPQRPQSVFGGGSSNGAGILPSNIASAAATVSIGNQIVTISSGASAITIGDHVVTAGGPAITAAGGTVVSLSPSDSILVVAGSSITLGATAVHNPGLTDIIAGSLLPLPSAQSSITVEGTTSAQSNLPNTIPESANSRSGLSKILLLGGSSITALPSMAAATPSAQLPALPPIITIAGSPVTLLPTDSILILAGHTLIPGGPPITISGTPISYSGSASSHILLLGGSTITIPPSIATTNPSPKFPTQSPVITIAGSPVMLHPTDSALILAGQTLTPGGPPITISGTPVSLAPSANYILVGRTSSIPIPLTLAPTLEYITVGTQVFTATRASNGNLLVNGQTLTQGGEGITIGGTVVSLVAGAQGTEVVVGSATEGVGLGGYILSGIAGGWGTMTAARTGTSTAAGTGAGAGGTGTGTSPSLATGTGIETSTGTSTGTGIVGTSVEVSTGDSTRVTALTRWGWMVMGLVMIRFLDC